jgi:hypothetical protein
METQEEKFLFPKPISTRANGGYLAYPEVDTFSPSLSNLSWSEQEKNFHPVSQNRGNHRFSGYSYDKKGVRTSGGKNVASDIFHPDVCYMAPTLVRVRDEGSMSDLRKGIYESSPSVVEWQELDLAVDSFDYCVFGKTIEKILGVKFARTNFKDPGSKERAKIGILRRVLDDPFSSQKVKTLVNAELGKVDYSKMHEPQVSSTTKAVLDLLQKT